MNKCKQCGTPDDSQNPVDEKGICGYCFVDNRNRNRRMWNRIKRFFFWYGIFTFTWSPIAFCLLWKFTLPEGYFWHSNHYMVVSQILFFQIIGTIYFAIIYLFKPEQS